MKYFLPYIIYSFFCILAVLGMPFVAYAAKITTVTEIVRPGIVTLTVFVDPEGEAVNTFTGELSYPSDMVALESISTIDSVVGLWIERPHGDIAGTISWSGFTPGGFTGLQSPFTSAIAPGKLFQIVFRGVEAGPVGMDFTMIEVLKHDGKGSVATTTANPVSFILDTIPEDRDIPIAISADTDSVSVEADVIRDELVADNKWIALFSIDTNRVALDHYEIAESIKTDIAKVPDRQWKRAESPYVLTHQSRRHTVHIKAIATDGKIYTTSIAALPQKYSTATNWILWSILGVLVVVFVVVKWRTRN